MAYPADLLSKDEEVALDLRPHWATLLAPGTLLAVGVVATIVAVFFIERWPALDWIALGLLVIAALYFAYHWTIWNTTQFVVTNERVISRVGVVSKKGLEIPLDQISAVTFNQTMLERLVGAGDLGIESSSEGGVQSFSNVRRPNHVQQEIYRMTEMLEERHVSRIGEAVSSGTATIPEQIQHLDDLRRSGALTDKEFKRSKTALLARLEE